MATQSGLVKSKASFYIFLRCIRLYNLLNYFVQNTAIFDIKSVPSEHGPSISGLNQSIKGYAAVIDNYPIRSSNYEQNLYMAQISFFQPNLVIDPRQGKLWDIELRLGNVSITDL